MTAQIRSCPHTADHRGRRDPQSLHHHRPRGSYLPRRAVSNHATSPPRIPPSGFPKATGGAKGEKRATLTFTIGAGAAVVFVSGPGRSVYLGSSAGICRRAGGAAPSGARRSPTGADRSQAEPAGGRQICHGITSVAVNRGWPARPATCGGDMQSRVAAGTLGSAEMETN